MMTGEGSREGRGLLVLPGDAVLQMELALIRNEADGVPIPPDIDTDELAVRLVLAAATLAGAYGEGTGA